MGDYSVKFEFFLSAFFFNSFHFMVFIILLSLLRGLIWEVFIVVDSIIKPEANPNNIKNYFKSFGVSDEIKRKNLSSGMNKTLKSMDSTNQKKRMNIKTLIYTKKKQEESSNLKLSSGAFSEKISNKNENQTKKSSLKFSIIEDEKKDPSATPIIDKSINHENVIEDSFENSKRFKMNYVSSLYIYKDYTPPFDFHKKPLIFSRGINTDTKENENNDSETNKSKTEKHALTFVQTDTFKKSSDESKNPLFFKSDSQINENENKYSKEHKPISEINIIRRNQSEKNIKNVHSATFKTKTDGKTFTEKQKNLINFYLLKIKRLKYFQYLQGKSQECLPEKKFDENTDIFFGKNKDSMKVLEESLFSNLEDEQILDNFLPKKNESPMEMEMKPAAKKKNQGINYGNSKDFLLKTAFLKDFNMDQIKVFCYYYFLKFFLFLEI